MKSQFQKDILFIILSIFIAVFAIYIEPEIINYFSHQGEMHDN